MIPQEKIKQAAGKYRDNLLKEAKRTMGMPKTFSQINAMAEGFADGYNHALIDYQNIAVENLAIEFLEWKEENNWKRTLRRDSFSWYKEGDPTLLTPFESATAPELFAKFMAERGAQ